MSRSCSPVLCSVCRSRYLPALTDAGITNRNADEITVLINSGIFVLPHIGVTIMTSLLNHNAAQSPTFATETETETEVAQNDLSSSVAITSSRTALSLVDIQTLLPHRYPLLLVDQIIDYVPGKRAVGIKNVTANEPQFQGHFPGRPIMPGVLMVEAMAQVAGILLMQIVDPGENLLLFIGINKVRFRRQVVPGDQLVMTVEPICLKQQRYAKVQAKAEVGGELATAGELSFALGT